MGVGRHDRGTWRRIYNNHGTNAPAGCVGKITGLQDAHNALIVTRPDGDNLENIIIIPELLEAGGYGIGYEVGTHPVEYSGDVPVVDDRLGSVTDQWLPGKSDDGTLLVRAVSGGTAWVYPFRAAGVQAGNPLDEWAEVHSDVPGSTFNYKGTTVTAFKRTVGGFGQKRIVFKLETPITSSASFQKMVALGDSPQPYIQYIFYDDYSGTANVPMRLNAITQDFDCSTVTWTSLLALSKAAVRFDIYFAITDPRSGQRIWVTQEESPHALRLTCSPVLPSSVYGFVLFFDTMFPAINDWSAEIRLNRIYTAQNWIGIATEFALPS